MRSAPPSHKETGKRGGWTLRLAKVVELIARAAMGKSLSSHLSGRADSLGFCRALISVPTMKMLQTCLCKTLLLLKTRKSWALVDVPVDLSLNLSEAEHNYPLTAAHGRSRMSEGQDMSGCSDRQASAALRELSFPLLSRTRLVPRREYIVIKGAIRETLKPFSEDSGQPAHSNLVFRNVCRR